MITRLMVALLFVLAGSQRMSTTTEITISGDSTGTVIADSSDGETTNYSRVFDSKPSTCSGVISGSGPVLSRPVGVFDMAPYPDCLEATAASLTIPITTVNSASPQIQIRVGVSEDIGAMDDDDLFVMFNETGTVPPVDTESLFVADITPSVGDAVISFPTDLDGGHPLQRINDTIANNKQLLIGVKVKGVSGLGAGIVLGDGPWKLTMTLNDTAAPPIKRAATVRSRM